VDLRRAARVRARRCRRAFRVRLSCAGPRASRCCGRNCTRRYFSMRRAYGVTVGVQTTEYVKSTRTVASAALGTASAETSAWARARPRTLAHLRRAPGEGRAPAHRARRIRGHVDLDHAVLVVRDVKVHMREERQPARRAHRGRSAWPDLGRGAGAARRHRTCASRPRPGPPAQSSPACPQSPTSAGCRRAPSGSRSRPRSPARPRPAVGGGARVR